MNATAVASATAIALVAVASAVLGVLGHRARRTSDFEIAARRVSPIANAGAISGEYLSAASFLGIAGIVLLDGVDGLWFPVGFMAGYLALLLFVAAPLRRSGAYTVPDFADARLGSPTLRRICSVVVLVIGWLYLLPQLQGAGLTVEVVTGVPAWAGAAASGVAVVASVAIGGTRSVTFVQAFQYWFKIVALTVPVLLALPFFFGSGYSYARDAPPTFAERTTVRVHTDVVLEAGQSVTVDVATGGAGIDDARLEPGAAVVWPAGSRHAVTRGSALSFPAGSAVPTPGGAPATDEQWLRPLSGDAPYQVLAIYSLIVATFLGTMGLPHVLMRFYTNPDGRAARHSAVLVMAMLGGFYLVVTLLGALSRYYTPRLLVSGRTDAAVLLLPVDVLGSGVAGAMLAGLVAAGAWAAFVSTSSGLLTSLAAVLTTVMRGRPADKRIRDFRVGTVLAGAAPVGLALVLTPLGFTETVALAFAVAASTFCPLLLLGVWWRGLTAPGAIAGVVTGGVTSAGAVGLTLAGVTLPGFAGVLLARPAIVTVPLAFAVVLAVSLATARRRPVDAAAVMLQLHAPERLGLSRDQPEERRPDA